LPYGRWVVGFAFMVGDYRLLFVMSLYLQQLHGLSSLAPGRRVPADGADRRLPEPVQRTDRGVARCPDAHHQRFRSGPPWQSRSSARCWPTQASFRHGLCVSLAIALATAGASLLLQPHTRKGALR
jgi:hypothetical protein